MISSSYAAAWNTYRRRRNGMITPFIALGAAMGLDAIAPTASFMAIHRSAVALILAAWFMFVTIRLYYWPCPRCKEPFFSRVSFEGAFARRCSHCGLAKWSDPQTGARGA